MAAIPGYVARFRDALVNERVGRLQLELCTPPVHGYHGILTTSRIRYNDERINLLGRRQEFTFELPDRRLELFLQLYLNLSNHWRLFCYTATGMLLSVNLTLLRQQSHVLSLSQTLHIISRRSSPADRRDRSDQLAAALSRLGLEVDRGRLVLGTFDADAGRFVDTTARAFLRDFTLASLMKGHFMGNKGYQVPGLRRVKPATSHVLRNGTSAGRLIPLWLRYQVIEDGGGRCAACGRTPKDGIKLHVDHIKPYSHGGRTERANLQVLCHEDNQGKGNRSETRFSSVERQGRAAQQHRRADRPRAAVRSR